MSSEGPTPPYDPQGEPGQGEPGQGQPGQGQPGQGQPGQGQPGWGQPSQPDQGPTIYPPPGTQAGAQPGGQPGGQPGQAWGSQQPQFAPPLQDPYAHLRRDHPRATTALVLGIVGLVLCGIASPFAWRIGKTAVDEIDRSQGLLTGRGQAQAGYILGLIGTILLGLSVVLLFVFVLFGLAAGFSSSG